MNHAASQVESPCLGAVAVPFKVALDTNNNPTIVEGKGILKSAAYGGSAGKFVLTLVDGVRFYNGLVASGLSMQAAAAVDLVPQIRAEDLKGAGSLTIELLTAAVPTNPPAKGANATFLSGVLWVRDSSVPY